MNSQRAPVAHVGRLMTATSSLAKTRRLLFSWVRNQTHDALKSRGRIILQNLRHFRGADDEATRRALIANVAALQSAICAARLRTFNGSREAARAVDNEIARMRLYGELAKDVRAVAFANMMDGAEPARAAREAHRQVCATRKAENGKETSYADWAHAAEETEDED
jgi:hypothetical protein